MHSSAVVGSRLYVMGGNSERLGFMNQVWSAPIASDGRVGAWREEAPLPDCRHYTANATQVINNRIYIVGGTTADVATADERDTRQTQTVLFTTVRADGTLGGWRVSDPFPGNPRSNAATASNQGWLYVTGGAFNRQPIADVAVARIGADGAPTGWRVVASLPKPLWFHGVAIQQERLFVWGGLSTSTPDSASAEVWSAEVRADGGLGEWRAEPPLPAAIYSSAYCGFNDRLIAVCGRFAGNVVTQNILVGQIQNGRIAGWRALSTDLQAHLYHGLGLDESRGFVFVVGGRRRTSSVNTLEGAILTEIRAFQMGGGTQSPAATGVLQAMRTLPPGGSPPKGQEAILYFRSSNVPSCERFEREVLSTAPARALLQGRNVYAVDTALDSQASYRYGLFKVPSMARLGPDGSVLKTAMGLRTLNDLIGLLE
jgi:hypothetical protein